MIWISKFGLKKCGLNAIIEVTITENVMGSTIIMNTETVKSVIIIGVL